MPDTRPDYPITLPGPTGPLPRGWHRLTFRMEGFTPDTEPSHVVSSSIASIALLKASLEKSPDVVPGSIVLRSWSDYPPSMHP